MEWILASGISIVMTTFQAKKKWEEIFFPFFHLVSMILYAFFQSVQNQ